MDRAKRTPTAATVGVGDSEKRLSDIFFPKITRRQCPMCQGNFIPKAAAHAVCNDCYAWFVGGWHSQRAARALRRFR